MAQARGISAFAESFLRAIPLNVSVVDEDMNIVYVNRELEGRIGKGALGTKCYLALKDNHQQCPECPLKKPINVGESSSLEVEDALGGRTLKITHSAIESEGETLILEILEDITERKQSDELIRALSNSPTIGIYIVQKGKFRFVNPQFQKLTGYGESDLLGTDSLAFVLPEDRDLVRHNAISMLKGELSSPYEYRSVNKAGEVRWIMEAVIPIHYGGGRAALGNFMDITGRKRAEEALQEAHDTLEQKVKERTADLARSNADLQQFAYVASHDLQEPLRAIAGYVQLLARRYKGKLDADADDFISEAADGAARMQALIDDLLAYSRVGTKGQSFKSIDCSAVLHSVLTSLRPDVEKKEAVITFDPLPTVMADALQLSQLFQNLIGNAIKFHGKEPPRVHVSAARKGDEWVFAVRDNGIGIAPQYFERIFLLFQRLHGRSRYLGTGIGLAICKKIVERHGGHIWVESEHGKGATFCFTIPVRGDIQA